MLNASLCMTVKRQHCIRAYLSMMTGSEGVSFRLPQLFLSQHRLSKTFQFQYFIHLVSVSVSVLAQTKKNENMQILRRRICF